MILPSSITEASQGKIMVGKIMNWEACVIAATILAYSRFSSGFFATFRRCFLSNGWKR